MQLALGFAFLILIAILTIMSFKTWEQYDAERQQ
jgi:hypothetical protein